VDPNADPNKKQKVQGMTNAGLFLNYGKMIQLIPKILQKKNQKLSSQQLILLNFKKISTRLISQNMLLLKKQQQ